MRQGRKRVRDEAAEDSIRGHEKSTEESDERKAERGAARNRAHALRTDRAADILPFDVLVQQVNGSSRGGTACGDRSARVIADRSPVHTRLRTPQRSERHGTAKRQQVHSRQEP